MSTSRDAPVLRWRPGAADVARSILYLHGLGSSQDGAKARAFGERFVRRGFSFCSLDFRGHGESGGTLAETTLTRHLEDVRFARRFLAEKGVERIVLFGSSLGGLTALWSAALDPRGVDGVLAVAPAVDLRNALLERAGGPGEIDLWRTTGRRTFASDVGSGELGWCLVEDLDRYPTAELTRRLRVPALLFQGGRDASVSWESVGRFAAECERADVRVVLFGRGDHRLLERLDEIGAKAEGFVGIGGASGGGGRA